MCARDNCRGADVDASGSGCGCVEESRNEIKEITPAMMETGAYEMYLFIFFVPIFKDLQPALAAVKYCTTDSPLRHFYSQQISVIYGCNIMSITLYVYVVYFTYSDDNNNNQLS